MIVGALVMTLALMASSGSAWAQDWFWPGPGGNTTCHDFYAAGGSSALGESRTYQSNNTNPIYLASTTFWHIGTTDCASSNGYTAEASQAIYNWANVGGVWQYAGCQLSYTGYKTNGYADTNGICATSASSYRLQSGHRVWDSGNPHDTSETNYFYP